MRTAPQQAIGGCLTNRIEVRRPCLRACITRAASDMIIGHSDVAINLI